MLADASTSTVTGGPPIGFLIFWAVLGISSGLFFHFNRNAALKRIVFPIFMVVMAATFGAFALYTTGDHRAPVAAFLIPMLVLISFINIRQTQFCDSCGRTLTR